MKRILMGVILPSLLFGCSSFDYDAFTMGESETDMKKNQDYVMLKSNEQMIMSNGQTNAWMKSNNQLSKPKNINDYARGIMQDLLSNLQYVGATTPVAVANFVYLDSDFNSSPLIGKQLSEAFMHEVHKLGIPVVDHKLTDYIRVSVDGDLALSKDFLELSGDIPIRYVLTGTLVNDGNSTIVNARIVGVESKAIVASAQGVLPLKVTQSINYASSNDGIF